MMGARHGFCISLTITYAVKSEKSVVYVGLQK